MAALEKWIVEVTNKNMFHINLNEYFNLKVVYK